LPNYPTHDTQLGDVFVEVVRDFKGLYDVIDVVWQKVEFLFQFVVENLLGWFERGVHVEGHEALVKSLEQFGDVLIYVVSIFCVGMHAEGNTFLFDDFVENYVEVNFEVFEVATDIIARLN
jgi:hypothetical protein